MPDETYLIDTNVLIDYLAGEIPDANNRIDEIFRDSFVISVISKIEFLGWNGYLDDADELDRARTFLEGARVIDLREDIADRVIRLRRNRGVPLADGVIAATALQLHATLVTRNISDFSSVPNLQLYNPHESGAEE